eukprot:15437951-Alexandrium_andersonii.AAC.1
MGPELTQRAVPDLLTLDQATQVVALQPALLRPKGAAAGHPVARPPDRRRAARCCVAGPVAPAPIDRLGDVEDALNALELKL